MSSEMKIPRKRFRGLRNGISYSEFAKAFANFETIDFDAAKATTFAPDQSVGEVFDEPRMWVELADFFEDAFELRLMDTDLWERLADQHSTSNKPIRDSLTFYQLWLFIGVQPTTADEPEEFGELSPYRELLAEGNYLELTRCFIAENHPTFPDDDWELLPDSYRLDLSDERQMCLFVDLGVVADQMNFDIEVETFFKLFNGVQPTVAEVLAFMSEAYTADIA